MYDFYKIIILVCRLTIKQFMSFIFAKKKLLNRKSDVKIVIQERKL